MRILAPVLATISLAALLGSTTTPAVAAGETCQGQPATVVGPGDSFGRLNGTEGNDVIVAEGATYVEALGGDDLVCVTVATASVHAGAGNDAVDASSGLGGSTYLGSGSDRYLGSAARENVAAGASSYGQDAEYKGGLGIDHIDLEMGPKEDLDLDLGRGTARTTSPPSSRVRTPARSGAVTAACPSTGAGAPTPWSETGVGTC